MENKETLCCDQCPGGYGWVWKSADLGNRHRVGNTSYKAGQQWAEVCPQWEGDEEPPAPPGISDMSRYTQGQDGFANARTLRLKKAKKEAKNNE